MGNCQRDVLKTLLLLSLDSKIKIANFFWTQGKSIKQTGLSGYANFKAFSKDGRQSILISIDSKNLNLIYSLRKPANIISGVRYKPSGRKTNQKTTVS